MLFRSESTIAQWQQNPLSVSRSNGSRWALSDEEQLLFVNGEIYPLTDETWPLAKYLSDSLAYNPQALLPLVEQDSALELLGQLVANGGLLPAEL